MNDSFIEKVNEIRHPAVYKLNKAKEMQNIIRTTKQGIIRFFRPRRNNRLEPPLKISHEVFRFRPYFAEFASELMKFADLYLYSLADP